jgi:selenocysteine-specific elongation factor
MIVATAGHVDHGKTTLVKALTGVDADRLPEEKKRGMTIDLGYAYLPQTQGRTIGFIDVPGHERFVHNMLCGLAGIDAVMVVVAADDGVMPQTREHLCILDLLGITRGLAAITKTDRVDAQRVRAVGEEIARLAAGTSLADMPVFPVAANSGAGIGALAAHLRLLERNLPARPATGNFRLAVDRSFTLPGAGLIVTGTVVSGAIDSGAAVRAHLADVPARVRGLHAQNAPAPRAVAGQRCALNLAGEIKAAEIRRGDWIVAADVAPPVARFDVRLRVPAGEKPLRHWTPVHAHLGASDITGRVALLEGDLLMPGGHALAQLLLDAPVGTARGDRLVLRDQSARRTIAGGVVLDVYPPARGRARPERLAALRAQEHEPAGAALTALLDAQPEGVDLERFARNRNLAPAEAEALFAAQPMRRIAGDGVLLGYAPVRWADLRNTALAALAAWHSANPDAPGLPPARLLAGSGARLPRAALAALADELLEEKRLMRAGPLLRLPEHRAQFNPADAALWEQIETLLRTQAGRPPVSSEIAGAIGVPAARAQSLLERAARQGLVFRVAPTRFFLPQTVRHLAGLTREIAEHSADRRVTPVALRERCALGRNLAVEVLEFFDRAGYTRRMGESRLVVKSPGEVFGPA